MQLLTNSTNQVDFSLMAEQFSKVILGFSRVILGCSIGLYSESVRLYGDGDELPSVDHGHLNEGPWG